MWVRPVSKSLHSLVKNDTFDTKMIKMIIFAKNGKNDHFWHFLSFLVIFAIFGIFVIFAHFCDKCVILTRLWRLYDTHLHEMSQSSQLSKSGQKWQKMAKMVILAIFGTFVIFDHFCVKYVIFNKTLKTLWHPSAWDDPKSPKVPKWPLLSGFWRKMGHVAYVFGVIVNKVDMTGLLETPKWPKWSFWSFGCQIRQETGTLLSKMALLAKSVKMGPRGVPERVKMTYNAGHAHTHDALVWRIRAESQPTRSELPCHLVGQCSTYTYGYAREWHPTAAATTSHTRTRGRWTAETQPPRVAQRSKSFKNGIFGHFVIFGHLGPCFLPDLTPKWPFCQKRVIFDPSWGGCLTTHGHCTLHCTLYSTVYRDHPWPPPMATMATMGILHGSM